MNLFKIPPQTGVSFEMKRGQYLEVIDPEGQQVSDLYCYNKNDPSDALSSGRSLDYNDQLFLSTGHILYSQKSLPMLTIAKDTCGRHDFLVTPCSLEMFHIVSGNQDYHPSCLENLQKAFKKYGLPPESIGSSFNIFMHISVAPNGKIKVEAPLSKAGDSILLKAEMDLIVALTACSDEGTNHGRCKPIHYRLLDEL